MAQEALIQDAVRNLLAAVPGLIQLHKPKIWLDYDSEADALYLHFDPEPSSNHSEMRDDGIIVDYRDDDLVGLTILDASSR